MIALGVRDLDPSLRYLRVRDMDRDEAERDVRFLGLIVMENRVKPESTPVVQLLRGANLRVVMVTGDNVNTAVSVARECGIVPKGGRLVAVTATAAQEQTTEEEEEDGAFDKKPNGNNNVEERKGGGGSEVAGRAKVRYQLMGAAVGGGERIAESALVDMEQR